MKRPILPVFLYRSLQIVWGFPQTAAGFVLFLFHLKRPHSAYRGSIVTSWGFRSSVSLGMFLFLTDSPMEPGQRDHLLRHEYGHTVQSLVFGPLYLLFIGLPSVLWAVLPTFRKRRKAGLPYSAFYTESGADRFGGIKN